MKLHLVLDPDGYLPCFGVVTDGKVADVKVAQWIDFGAGTIVVDDRGSSAQNKPGPPGPPGTSWDRGCPCYRKPV
ncbi:MAG: hypothetical protein EOP82_27365 [Variovorax sp.]|nr:MAG: hypothetical protein EOP82_27365 [Variovorax sp.]